MEKQSLNKHIATYKMLQDIPALNMPCPRCGQHHMKKDMAENALSRYTDIYICSDCGRDEAMLGASEQMPKEKMVCGPFSKRRCSSVRKDNNGKNGPVLYVIGKCFRKGLR